MRGKVYSPEEFGVHLMVLGGLAPGKLERALNQCAKKIQHTAEASLGKGITPIGPYSAWEPLTPDTQEKRERGGFTPDKPLLETEQLYMALGELDSLVEIDIDVFEVAIGIKSGPYIDPFTGVIRDIGEIALAHEVGTSTMPPRPFLGPAGMRNEKYIRAKLGEAGVICFLGTKELPSALFSQLPEGFE